ncbi:MAG TPA: carboxymuconolactone decarboxylase family protein [Candidatus Acidoferrales bacterium]|nr:carboxymuconolactone decarboxylase family protein [Candidatus Acidoferrales bacterium]
MLMLYAGYPAALEGLRVLNGVWPGRARRSREGPPARWRAAGERLCARVYGPAFARLVPAVRALHPDLGVWMIEHGYGRVLSRPGLSARERELVTVAALAAAGWPRQLASHLLGAARVGASAAEIAAARRIGERALGRPTGVAPARMGDARPRGRATRPSARAPRPRPSRTARVRRASQRRATPSRLR